MLVSQSKLRTESWGRQFAAQTKLRLEISQRNTRTSSNSGDNDGFHRTCRPAASQQFPISGLSEWNGVPRFRCQTKHCCSALASEKKFPFGMNKSTNSFPKPKHRSP